jgi:multidrug efflux pump subunit AcrA (membrane-fusion protein)
VFVPLERLMMRLRQPASRAAEIATLRKRLRAERAATVDDDESTLATEVAQAKHAVAAAIGSVVSCGSCAARQPWPIGAFAGGACCAGVTASVFDDHELAALAGAGTRPRDLRPPAGRDAHAGCAFRGAEACSLALEHRPARCVHYVCDTLRAELHRRGTLDDVTDHLAELDRAMRAFTAVHRARQDREVLAPVIEAVRAATRRGTTRTPSAGG